MVLHGINGYGTKWNWHRIARKPREERGRVLEADRDSLPVKYSKKLGKKPV